MTLKEVKPPKKTNRRLIIAVTALAVLSILITSLFVDRVSLLTTLVKNGPTPLKVFAIARLSVAGDTRAYDVIVDALADTNIKVRTAAARALGRLKDKRAVKPLSDALKGADPAFAEAAAWALGEIGDEGGMKSLINLLRTTREPEVIKAALPSLVKIAARYYSRYASFGHGTGIYIFHELFHGTGSQREEDVSAIYIEALAPELKSEDAKVRGVAAMFLSYFSTPDIAEPLLGVVKDTNPQVRKYALYGLGNIGDSRALDPLLAALDDTDYEMRTIAIKFLAKFKDPRIPDAVLGHLKDSDPGSGAWRRPTSA